MKLKFTYSTSADRIKRLKAHALEEDTRVNLILDEIIDEYLERIEIRDSLKG